MYIKQWIKSHFRDQLQKKFIHCLRRINVKTLEENIDYQMYELCTTLVRNQLVWIHWGEVNPPFIIYQQSRSVLCICGGNPVGQNHTKFIQQDGK